jgi:hypothetical protein
MLRLFWNRKKDREQDQLKTNDTADEINRINERIDLKVQHTNQKINKLTDALIENGITLQIQAAAGSIREH